MKKVQSAYTHNLSRGQTLYRTQCFEEALGCFKKALMLEPHSHVAWNEKGNTLRRLGRHEEAMDCYERAIHLDKKRSYPFPYIGIADMYREQEQYPMAILYYDKALGIKRHPWALNGKGVCLFAQNQTDKALELAEEAIRARPKFLYPYILKGDILSERVACQDALRSYRKAFDLIRGSSPELREEVENKIARCSEMLDHGNLIKLDDGDRLVLMSCLHYFDRRRNGSVHACINSTSWQREGQPEKSRKGRSMISSGARRCYPGRSKKHPLGLSEILLYRVIRMSCRIGDPSGSVCSS